MNGLLHQSLLDPALGITPEDGGLLTDLYQLTMSACYAGEGLDQRTASFELFARRLPDDIAHGETWRQADVTDPAAIRRALAGCDAVLHLACVHSN